MADPAGRDPAEGSRETIDRELARDSAKNPGRPADAVKDSASPHPADPQGRQGSQNINKDR
jgi:hypothetical protein